MLEMITMIIFKAMFLRTSIQRKSLGNGVSEAKQEFHT